MHCVFVFFLVSSYVLVCLVVLNLSVSPYAWRTVNVVHVRDSSSSLCTRTCPATRSEVGRHTSRSRWHLASLIYTTTSIQFFRLFRFVCACSSCLNDLLPPFRARACARYAVRYFSTQWRSVQATKRLSPPGVTHTPACTWENNSPFALGKSVSMLRVNSPVDALNTGM